MNCKRTDTAGACPFPSQQQPLLLCQVEPPQGPDGGDYYYRTHAPGLAMSQEEGVFVVNLTNLHRQRFEIMERADVLILKNICDPDLLPILAARKLAKRPTVFEIADDLSALQPWNPVYPFYLAKENQALIRHMASCSDALQVTCRELERIYGPLNPRCEVFPNQILELPPPREKRDGGEVVIGWGGSHGHLEDMEEIALPLMKSLTDTPNAHLRLMCSDPIWALFDSLPEPKKSQVPTGSIQDYCSFLGALDIGIAPLKDTAFNRSRSDIKFLEYAAAGVVPVVKHLRPYEESVVQGKTGFLYRDSDELISCLSRLARDPGLRAMVASAARDYVERQRMQKQDAGKRVAFYRHLLHATGNGKRDIPSFQGDFLAWSALPGAVKDGGHLKLEPTRFELLLHDGLVAMQTLRDSELARHLFQEASALVPQDYLPFLFSSSLSTDPIACLMGAIERRPLSVKAWTLLGEEFMKKGDPRKGLECLDTALRIYPRYEVPLLRAAEFLRKTGQSGQAERLLAAAAGKAGANSHD